MVMISIGDKARDAITGFEGVVIAKTAWLHGCNRLTLQPCALHEGKPIDVQTFDEGQLALIEAGWWTRMGMEHQQAPAAEKHEAKPGGPRPEPRRPSTPR